MIEPIYIPIPTLFSFNETLSFLDRGYDECLYHLTSDSVSKLIDLNNEKSLITISREKDNLKIVVQKDKFGDNDLDLARAYVSEWFDLKRDIQPFYTLLKQDKQLSFLSEKYYGTRIVSIPNLFEALCWAIIGQQINLTFAYKCKRRLVEKYGEKQTINGQIYFSFPTPEKLIKAKPEELIEMQFSRQKIKYLSIICKHFIEKKINRSILLNSENKLEKLTQIKGIGIWSANYVLMKSLREMTCITYGDSGLNAAIHKIFNTEKRPTKGEIDHIFSKFNNWESYLNFYLWKSLK